MRYLSIFVILASLFSIHLRENHPLLQLQDPVHAEQENQAEEGHRGSLRSVTTTNMWISDDNKNNKWVIDVEGTPEKKYVVDSPARKEISHYETVNYPAVTHQEPVYETRNIYYVDYPYGTAAFPRETYYDFNEALAAAGMRDGNITEASETYISGYTTVIDRAAYSETIKVIDQKAREEVGHYETEIVGEIGHWEQGKKRASAKAAGNISPK